VAEAGRRAMGEARAADVARSAVDNLIPQ
jgi:hypothetical protein